MRTHIRTGSTHLRLVEQADTDYESAADWYGAYGWHISTERCGDICLDAIPYDELDQGDEAIVARLCAEWDGMTRDEASDLVARARSVREAADEVAACLRQAVDMYELGDQDGVERALADARRIEGEHGDTPASDALASQLLEDREEEEA